MNEKFKEFNQDNGDSPKNTEQDPYINEFTEKVLSLAKETNSIAVELDDITNFLKRGEASEPDIAEAKNRKQELLKRQKEVLAEKRKMEQGLKNYMTTKNFKSERIN
jgi:translation initiation factor 2B subunit (eIF-2B alpha/beta/delta family)